jgi:hypothetical protein
MIVSTTTNPIIIMMIQQKLIKLTCKKIKIKKMNITILTLTLTLLSLLFLLTYTGGFIQTITWYRHMILSLLSSTRFFPHSLYPYLSNSTSIHTHNHNDEFLKQQLRERTKQLHELQAQIETGAFIPRHIHEQLKSRAIAMTGEMLTLRNNLEIREAKRGITLAKLDKDCRMLNNTWIRNMEIVSTRNLELNHELTTSREELKLAQDQIDSLQRQLDVARAMASTVTNSKSLAQDLAETRKALEEARQQHIQLQQQQQQQQFLTTKDKTSTSKKSSSTLPNSNSGSTNTNNNVLTAKHLAQLAAAAAVESTPNNNNKDILKIKTDLKSSSSSRPTIKIDCVKESYVFNTIRSGDAYSSIVASSANRCKKMCASEQHCKSWVFITATGMCNLKDKYGVSANDECCVSGVRCKI